MSLFIYEKSKLQQITCSRMEYEYNKKSIPNGMLICITDDYYDNIYEKIRPKNCINCGAPLHRYICDYCGTEY